MSLTLVTGGTRSGKSARAEALALATGRPVRYVATADAADDSMAERIAAHAARRPAGWTTVEVNGSLADAVGSGSDCVLVDGLGAWLARVMDFDAPERARDAVRAEVDALVDAAARRTVIVVAEEAGQGVLPSGSGTRAWLDLLGDAVQRLAAGAERVELVVAGRPIALPPGVAGGGVWSLGLDGGDKPTTPGAEPAVSRIHADTLVLPGDADHAVNVMSGGPPQWLREVLEAALSDVARYPDERVAVAALAALHGRAPDEIVPTNGAAEALWLLPAALRPALAACVHPAFSEGEAALRAHGVPVARVLRDPERGFALDPDAVPDAADLVLVGNPVAASGTLDPAAAVLALRRRGRTVVVDEAFMDMVPGEPGSLVRDAPGDVVVVRSLTKSFAVPGLRAGYAVAAPSLAERLRAVRPPWSVNALALAAMAAAAQRPDAFAAAAERVAAEREDLEGRLRGIARVRLWPASANYCLVEVPDGPRVAAALREAGIAVRPAASFPGLGPEHLRITARGPTENARLAEALSEAVAACP
jgi:histidinol-phosphate/aromatic aminotransferase/cobyric acid decarboxylase-like protein/adenosyl cobinamide kinase/adenosyl cobinamide phosphate guanylyltransferase